MYVAPIKNNNNCNISFNGNMRVYKVKQNGIYRDVFQSTCMCRQDLDWGKFIRFLSLHFKKCEHVNIHNTACSDGSESFWLVSAMKLILQKGAEKFMPVMATDRDAYIIKVAKKALVNATDDNLSSIKKYFPQGNPFMKQSDKKLKIAGDHIYYDVKTFEIDKEIQKNIIFEKRIVVDELNKIEDNSNTVFLARNVFPYLKPEERKTVCKLAGEKLKKDSVFVIGDADYIAKAPELLEQNGFSEVISNHYNSLERVFVKK